MSCHNFIHGVEWNSVDSKDTGNESTAPKDRDGGAGGGNDESTLPRSLSQNQLGRNSRSDASTSSSSSALAPTNAVHVQFEGDQVRCWLPTLTFALVDRQTDLLVIPWFLCRVDVVVVVVIVIALGYSYYLISSSVA